MKRVMLILTLLLFMVNIPENVAGADLFAGEETSSSVRLTWTEDTFCTYEIYIDEGDGWRLLKTIDNGGTTEYRVTGLEAGKTYRFKVRSVGSILCDEGDSNIVSVATEESPLAFLGNWFLIIIAVLLLIFGVVIGLLIARRKG